MEMETYVSAVSVNMSNTHTDDSLNSVNHCVTLSASMGTVLVTMYCCCGIDQ